MPTDTSRPLESIGNYDVLSKIAEGGMGTVYKGRSRLTGELVAIKIIPPGPVGQPADRTNAEKMPKEFEINMLRCIFCGFCQEVCPEEAIFLLKDYSLTGTSRAEMIYNKEKLLQLGGVHAGVEKWKHKLEEAKEQETFPVKL